MSHRGALTPASVLQFWFQELVPERWWRVDAELDQSIRERFGELHQAADAGELWRWREQPRGRLAEVIVLDQFSRNMYRGTPRAFASDRMALVLAQEAVALAADQQLPDQERAFLYMPYMHSESAVIQAEAERLFELLGLQGNRDAARRHKAIIDRFGRYPHRNTILGRTSTAEELDFLSQPGSSF